MDQIKSFGFGAYEMLEGFAQPYKIGPNSVNYMVVNKMDKRINRSKQYVMKTLSRFNFNMTYPQY